MRVARTPNPASPAAASAAPRTGPPIFRAEPLPRLLPGRRLPPILSAGYCIELQGQSLSRRLLPRLAPTEAQRLIAVVQPLLYSGLGVWGWGSVRAGTKPQSRLYKPWCPRVFHGAVEKPDLGFFPPDVGLPTPRLQRLSCREARRVPRPTRSVILFFLSPCSRFSAFSLSQNARTRGSLEETPVCLSPQSCLSHSMFLSLYIFPAFACRFSSHISASLDLLLPFSLV